MRRLSNPFTVRRSEHIDDIKIFLSLFESGMLDILDPEGWHKKVHLIRSAPGGGKSTLLTLFTPAALNNLYVRREEENLKVLYQKIFDLGALDENGVCLLGVKIQCGSNYAMLQDLDLDDTRKLRLFFSLLNSRIIIATVRAVIELKGLNFPQDVDKVKIEIQTDNLEINFRTLGLTSPCNGRDLLTWSDSIEGRICDALDSFTLLSPTELPGHEELFSLDLIDPKKILVDGIPVASQTLLMMDDVHTLTSWQRKKLIESIIERQSRIGIWIAERFQALSTEEMLAPGAIEGRDHNLIEIESYWRRHHKRFENNAMLIAKKRTRSRSDFSIDDFGQCLATDLSESSWSEKLEDAAATIQNRIQPKLDSSEAYRYWYEEIQSRPHNSWDKAIAWRSLEILIARHENRSQLSLFDDPLPIEDLNNKTDASLRQAAELFLARDFKLPYYYGVEKIARLASLNIQQFLGIAVNLFDDVLSRDFLKQVAIIPPDRQHSLVKESARQMWEQIPFSVKHGREVRNLLDSIGSFAQQYTYRPTAPNDPGVAGSGIRMSERSQLLSAQPHSQSKQIYEHFANVLASAMAHNLLIPDIDYKCKNDYWMVLNLNRLLCVHYDLPLGYGLYKERPLQMLIEWIDRPFVPNNKNLLS
jgi:hypothetical protein